MKTLSVDMKRNGEVAVIRPNGRLDAFEAPMVAEALAELEQAHVHYMVINLAHVDFMDSIALSTLVQGIKHALQSGGDLYLCSVQQPVQIIFELTRLDKVFRIFDTEENAVNAICV